MKLIELKGESFSVNEDANNTTERPSSNDDGPFDHNVPAKYPSRTDSTEAIPMASTSISTGATQPSAPLVASAVKGVSKSTLETAPSTAAEVIPATYFSFPKYVDERKKRKIPKWAKPAFNAAKVAGQGVAVACKKAGKWTVTVIHFVFYP